MTHRGLVIVFLLLDACRPEQRKLATAEEATPVQPFVVDAEFVSDPEADEAAVDAPAEQSPVLVPALTGTECIRCHTLIDPKTPRNAKKCAEKDEWHGEYYCYSSWQEPHQMRSCVSCHNPYRRDEVLRKADSGLGKVPVYMEEDSNYLQSPIPLYRHGRLRRAWVEQFLQKPELIRPNYHGRMPRLPLDPTLIAELSEWLAQPTRTDRRDLTAAVAGADSAKGQELYLQQGCPKCHVFEAVSLPESARGTRSRAQVRFLGDTDRSPRAGDYAKQMAPDLAHTRRRIEATTLVEWLGDPAKWAPGASMPAVKLPEAERLHLAKFILTAPLIVKPTPIIHAPPPLLERKVTWQEVETKIFHASCWHCHADPDFARGEGGPGNTGGFGYKGRGIVLADLTGVRTGGLDRDGKRQSLISTKDGESLLVRSLLARHAEEAGQPVPGITGMPLGLPPLPLEHIALLRTWIAQGARR